MVLHELPGAGDVLLSGSEVADREADYVAAHQLAALRKEDLARCVECLEKFGVEPFKLGFIPAHAAGVGPEADNAKRYRGQAFKIVMGVYPASEEPRETHMLSQSLTNTLGAEVA